VALWATQRLLPIHPGGAFARGLEASREAALALYQKLRGDRRFVAAFPPELDIVVWLVRAQKASEASELARRVFEETARKGLHLALADLPARFFDLSGAGMEQDRETITCLRSVLMKPEHRDWLPRIWEILDLSTKTVLRTA
jgi:hypothetical protein